MRFEIKAKVRPKMKLEMRAKVRPEIRAKVRPEKGHESLREDSERRTKDGRQTCDAAAPCLQFPFTYH